MNSVASTPSTGAAVSVVPRIWVGMMFCICKLPGICPMAKVAMARPVIPGNRYQGIPALGNRIFAKGSSTKIITVTWMPPYTSRPPTST